MAKLTNEDKIKINEVYLRVKTYSGTARETGFSPATVKKYVIPNYIPQENLNKTIFLEEEIPKNPDLSILINVINLGEICVLSEEERKEIKELWKELVV